MRGCQEYNTFHRPEDVPQRKSIVADDQGLAKCDTLVGMLEQEYGCTRVPS